MYLKNFLPFVLFILGLIALSCNDDIIATNPNSKLEFATDTLSFDTVFTTLGSTTKWLTVKNPNKQAVNIASIFLAGRESSNFRLNINGVQTNEELDVYIAAGDSIFIFVEVTVDPTGLNNPMVIKDSIVFNLNGSSQNIKLIAFGQDYHLFNGEIIQSQHWENDKPYLIYNSVLIDSLETLTIDAGCRIYFHKNSSLFVKGKLQANGTFEEPVYFQGDRLEKQYENIPGQWGDETITKDKQLIIYGGIHFLKGSKDNILKYVIIKNAQKGIQLDSMGFSNNPMLTISNSIIENMTLNCIDARTTFIKASNSVFANSGSYTVALLFGGKYEFNHCTVANYYSEVTRKKPALILNNTFEYEKITYGFDLNVLFGNCIVYGNNNNEISTNNGSTGSFIYSFKNCLLKTNLSTGFENSVLNKDPLFVDIPENNFAIDSLSPARNIGNTETAQLFPYDLNNQSRMADEGPDAGALEWIPTSGKK